MKHRETLTVLTGAAIATLALSSSWIYGQTTPALSTSLAAVGTSPMRFELHAGAPRPELKPQLKNETFPPAAVFPPPFGHGGTPPFKCRS